MLREGGAPSLGNLEIRLRLLAYERLDDGAVPDLLQAAQVGA
jgi:hypothetical protein